MPQRPYKRKGISTPDDDFPDLDWSRVNSRTLVILQHALEGNLTHAYIIGMVQTLKDTGVDALSWNYRGCSEEPNRQLDNGS